MREIKFRGKVNDEINEWVIGSLLIHKEIDEYVIYQDVQHSDSKCCGFGSFGVDKDTIGQFTGHYDKNGKEIYEGDIVKFTFDGCYCYYVVKFNDGMFGIWYIDDDNDEVEEDRLTYTEASELEVIGNIYDNPELLEEV